ncbi:hypothetical protein M8J76_001220 [Diaphorina citri]|nr:hypothetical protein M8J75_002753 [Diaphorina citri]KAI5748693.1 hypothetical protein M8J76_001220 [Diaphorina citri]
MGNRRQDDYQREFREEQRAKKSTGCACRSRKEEEKNRNNPDRDRNPDNTPRRSGYYEDKYQNDRRR